MSDEFEEPVILSFAMTPKEWGTVAAVLQYQVLQAKERGEVTTTPESISKIISTAEMFHKMIHDEMRRRAEA